MSSADAADQYWYVFGLPTFRADHRSGLSMSLQPWWCYPGWEVLE